MKNQFLPVLPEEETDTLEAVADDSRALVLYNDDFNTFDFVTDALIKVCGHHPLQAEQCTFLVHYKGKCLVKNGTYKSLRPQYETLLERGLTARIEKYTAGT